jgi:hypothetical protein
MRYSKNTLRDSFFGWLGVAAPQPPLQPQQQQHAEAGLKLIRRRMLQALMTGGPFGASDLCGRLVTAQDVQALWYQRTDLMQVLCRSQGEAQARAVLSDITRLFEGLLPAAMMLSASNQGPRRH